jgi:CRP-like cAMP-binding protein
MTTPLTQPAAFKNQILRGLPREKYQRLFANLKLVNLVANQIIYNHEDAIDSAYFINRGMASLLSTTAEGDIIEVGNIGNEGLVGVPVVLKQLKTPYESVVRVSGDAWVAGTSVLRNEVEKPGELRDRLLAYTHALTTYMSQLGVCNHFHTLDKRLCRWLLIASQQVQSETFQLTHESLSQVLGKGRSGITMAANRLQKSGLIRYQRGQLSILDRRGMEATSCACYKISKEIFEQLHQRE